MRCLVAGLLAISVLCLVDHSGAFTSASRRERGARTALRAEDFRTQLEKAKELLLGGTLSRLERMSEGLSVAEKEKLIDSLSEGLDKPPPPEPEGKALPAAAVGTHPVLGTELADLGDKKLYLTEVACLTTLPVWEKQRSYRSQRVRKIVNDKLKRRESGLPLSFPGAITVFEKAWVASSPKVDQELTRYGIVDGQHRVGALRMLHRDGHFDAPVLVEVIPLENDAAISDLFTDINKAEPVKDVDLPGMASDDDRAMLQSAVNILCDQFPDMFKDSTKCRKPHLNVDNLRDVLFTRGVMSRHKFTSSEALLTWILEKNSELSKRSAMDWARISTSVSFEKALTKSKSNGFYLGLDDEWLDS